MQEHLAQAGKWSLTCEAISRSIEAIPLEVLAHQRQTGAVSEKLDEAFHAMSVLGQNLPEILRAAAEGDDLEPLVSATSEVVESALRLQLAHFEQPLGADLFATLMNELLSRFKDAVVKRFSELGSSAIGGTA